MSSSMDIIVALENSENKKLAKSIKRTFMIKPVPKSDDKVRHVTDKYWCGFFIVVFITWIASWQYAVTHNETDALPHVIDYIIIPDNSTDEKNISEFSLREVNNTANNSSNGAATEKKNIEISELLYLYLYIFTCNLSHMDKYIEALGKFVIMIHLMCATGFCHISLLNMQRNKIFNKQPLIIGATFIFIALIEHLSKMFHSRNPAASPFLIFHENLTYWVIPEMMFLIVWLSKMLSTIDHEESEIDFFAKETSRNVINNDFFSDNYDKKYVEDIDNNDGPNADSDNVFEDHDFTDDMDMDCDDLIDNSDDDNYSNIVDNNVTHCNDSNEDPEDAVIPFHYYIYAIIFGFPFVIILKLLIMSTISVLHKLGWSSPYSYVIAGSSFYVGFTIYHFSLMLTACATNILIDRKNFTLDDLQRALYIVIRYHFGTACYHATVIFPRLHATLVSNESEFKIGARYPLLRKRFYTTHWQIYGLSPTICAARGHDHADSIRELLRLSCTVCVKKEYFRNFKSTMTKSLLAFLLSINCLTICLLWIFGIQDPHFAKATWLMYLSLTFAYYVVIRFFKTVSETIGLRLSGRQVNFHLGRWSEVYSKNVPLL